MLTATPSSAEAAEAARREHHGEFYGLRPLPADDGRPLVTVAGNCQAGSVRVLLDGAPSAPCRSVRVPPLHEPDRRGRAAAAAAARGVRRAGLPAGARRLPRPADRHPPPGEAACRRPVASCCSPSSGTPGCTRGR
nr:hypothetical protein [Angustibacter aerolatus]